MGLIGGFLWRLVGEVAEKGRDLEGVGGAVGSGAGGGARARSSGGGGAWLVMTGSVSDQCSRVSCCCEYFLAGV